MSGRAIQKNFTQGSVPKHLLVFAAPLFLSNMLQVVYNLVDMVIVGHVAGEVGLSAVSNGKKDRLFKSVLLSCLSMFLLLLRQIPVCLR